MNTSDKCDAISLACARTCVQIQAVLCTVYMRTLVSRMDVTVYRVVHYWHHDGQYLMVIT